MPYFFNEHFVYQKINNNKYICYNFNLLAGSVLRLAGGNWSGEGRVETFHNGSWGTVCDHYWDIKDAQVVCRQLGYPKALNALRNAWFGKGSGYIWLDDVECRGVEGSIDNCQHAGWNYHNCKHGEDASVICSSKLVKRKYYLRNASSALSSLNVVLRGLQFTWLLFVAKTLLIRGVGKGLSK